VTLGSSCVDLELVDVDLKFGDAMPPFILNKIALPSSAISRRMRRIKEDTRGVGLLGVFQSASVLFSYPSWSAHFARPQGR
jgi:hypothetical protein